MARQAPLSMGFSRQDYLSQLPLPDPEIQPGSSALQVNPLMLSQREPVNPDVLLIYSALLGVTSNSHRHLRGRKACAVLAIYCFSGLWSFFPGNPERIISPSFRSLIQKIAYMTLVYVISKCIS